MNDSAPDWQAGGFGVYIHWPFCLAKCPYCDFNSHVWQQIDQSRWAQALSTELRAAHALVPDRRVDTVFFGGGTPSLMAPQTVATLIETVEGLWGLSSGAEISLEANPTSVEAGRFAGYRSAGVNRLSMGVQALNDADLRALGRMHSAAEARAAFDIARAQFERVSFDLIYARSGQSLADWRAELTEALAMAVDHLSLYQLTIEPGTRFADLYDRGRLSVPEEETAADMYAATQEICEAAGMPAYEISNHARPGAQSRHNRLYWRYGDYVGVGPGAHGRLSTGFGRQPSETPRDPRTWLERVEREGAALDLAPGLSGAEQASEMLMMGLRLAEGIDPERFARLNGTPLPPERVAELADLGLIVLEDGRLRASQSGRAVLNAVLRALLV
ncbi:MAG: radical SAM family heme chaperone HemW [Neomegalonema sp.]|nr:radical SAM family heme chaperone HemW [Neomegalonema sp.]